MDSRLILAQAETSTTSGRLISTAVVIGIAIVLYAIARVVAGRLISKMEAKGGEARERAVTLWSVMRRVVLVVLAVTAILFIFSIWGISLAPLLAAGTVLAAAIGFGAQDLVKDVIAGLFILLEDQYHVGDTITIAGSTGTVSDIQLRVTVLRDLEGNAHFVPNGQITVAKNFTSLFAQPVIDLAISYESDVDHALAVMKDELDAFANDPEWSEHIRGESEVLGVNKLDDSAVIIRGRLTTAADERWMVRREALRRLKNRLDAEGITIPFPQLTIHNRE